MVRLKKKKSQVISLLKNNSNNNNNNNSDKLFFSGLSVSGEKPSEQRGVRHTEGGRESGSTAAPPRPCRAPWAGESAGGSKQ